MMSDEGLLIGWMTAAVGVTGLILLIVGVQNWWRRRSIPDPLMMNNNIPQKGWFEEHFDLRRDR